VATGKSPYTILKEYEQTITDSLIKSLENNNKIAGGMLAQSIDAKTKIFGQSISLQVYMNDYWKFIDRGVNGTVNKVGSEYSFKKKNLKAGVMEKFIRNRGIKQYKSKSGNVIFDVNKAKDKSKGYKTLAFLLGRGVSKFGIKPTNFVEDGISGIERQLEADLLEAVGRQIEVQLTVK
jgi:hypothetical protein